MCSPAFAKGVEDGRAHTDPVQLHAGIPNTTPQSMAQGMIYTENAADIGVDRCVLKGGGIAQSAKAQCEYQCCQLGSQTSRVTACT